MGAFNYQKRWKVEDFESHKPRIRDALLIYEEQNGPEAKLAFILDEVRTYQDLQSPFDQMILFLYIMNALSHHLKHGGLKDREIKKLQNMAETVLKINLPETTKSRLSTLYGDFYLLKSQLYQIEGDYWLAAWEHQVSIHLHHYSPSIDIDMFHYITPTNALFCKIFSIYFITIINNLASVKYNVFRTM